MTNETDNKRSVKHLPFDEGLPTKPDVDLLLRTWPEPKIGDRFEYGAIEKLLRLSWRDARFRTITTNWRSRLLDERGFSVYCEAGEAFYVAACDQVTGKTHGKLKHMGNIARRHRQHLATAKVVNDTQRSTVEHQARLMLAIEKDTKKARMNLLPATKVPDQPKIAPPTEQSRKEQTP